MIKSRLAVATVLSVIAYLGLAIVGKGGPGRFFSYPPLTAVTLVTIALGVAGLFSEGHIGAGVKEDRSNRWVVAALGVLGILDAYLPAYTDRVDFLTFGGEATRWLGLSFTRSAAFFALRRSLCLGAASAAWSRSSPNTDWRPAGSTGSFATRAISVSSFSCLVGAWRSAQGWVSSLPCCRSVSCSLASRLRSDC
jgi:hypothetical protein